MLEGDKVIQFRCHKDVKCWNACCANIDITLTPYDILRLKNRLNLSSGDFLKQYTVPYEMDQDGINAVLVDRGGAGKTVVRLKGGDPFVFGRGGEEAQRCAADGIPFEGRCNCGR